MECRLLITAVMFLCFTKDVRGYSSASFDYVANDACDQMFPSGHGVSGQVSASPFVVEAPETFTLGQSLTVTLKSTDGSSFKGFILQARRVDTDEKVGEFTVAPATKQNCGGNALSHTSPSAKTSLAITWTAPNEGVGDIKFVCTIVKEKNTFWVKETSSIVSEAPLPLPSPAPSEAPTEAETVVPTHAPTQRGQPHMLSDVDVGPCGRSKSCYRHPKDCVGNCDVIVTWQRDGHDKVAFQVQGTVTNDEVYIAIGLSTDDKMGDDSVTECVFSSSSAENTGVFMSFNGVYVNDRLSDAKLGLETTSSDVYYKDGQLICQFKRYITVNDPAAAALSSEPVAAAQSANVFQLNQEYVILVAKGDWSISAAEKSKHDTTIQSPAQVNLAADAIVNIGGTTGYPMVKAHGIIMIIAWMISASIAVQMPRHHKNSWPGKECGGKPIWFQIHMPLMLMTSFLTIAGFIIIFVSVGGYAEYPNYPAKVHPPLGIVTTILVVINPLMAACRPHPGTSKRPLFNVLHFMVGQGAHFLSVSTIAIAMYMSKVAAPSWSIWVIVAYICWHTLIEIILTIHKCRTKKRDTEEKYEMTSSEPAGERIRQNKASDKLLSAESFQSSKLETFLVLIHALGVIGLAVALIIPIATA